MALTRYRLLPRLHVLFKPTPSRLLDNSKPPRNCKADIRQPKEEPKEDACVPGTVAYQDGLCGQVRSQTCRDPDCYMGRIRPSRVWDAVLRVRAATTDKMMDDDPSLGCCCCNCWCHKMGDWCKFPNGNNPAAAASGSQCPLGSVLSGHSINAKWDPSVAYNTGNVERFKCTACEKGTYKDVTGRYDSLIVCPPGSPPATSLSPHRVSATRDGSGDWVEVEYCTDDQHPARTSCTACPAGKTTAGKGSTTACDCKAPPPPGSDEAAYWTTSTCSAGQYLSGSCSSLACTDCEAGKFKAGTNADTSCTACPSNANSAAAASDCSCNSGYSSAGSDAASDCTLEKKKTSPGGQTEGYWQSQGYNPADVAYIMAFGITALLATVVVVVEVVVPKTTMSCTEAFGMSRVKGAAARQVRTIPNHPFSSSPLLSSPLCLPVSTITDVKALFLPPPPPPGYLTMSRLGSDN